MLFLFFGAITLILAGLSLQPDHLIALGVMDNSLLSEDDVVRRVAHMEVTILKWALVIAGGLAVLITANRHRIARSAWYRTFMASERRFSPAYEALLPRIVTVESLCLFGLIAACFAYLVFGDAVLPLETRLLINLEDGVIEAASAVLLLVACGVCLAVAVSALPARAPRRMHLFLALLFFLMAGEEISWGQRYLGLETPEAILEVNVQGEINIHNLFGYFFDHLFILCFFIWGCLVPVLDRSFGVMRNMFRAIGLPIPGTGIAISMLIATLLQDQLVVPLGLGVEGLRIAEMRELISAVAFLAIASQSLRGMVWRVRGNDPANETTLATD